jgi:hypothetical protein
MHNHGLSPEDYEWFSAGLRLVSRAQQADNAIDRALFADGLRARLVLLPFGVLGHTPEESQFCDELLRGEAPGDVCAFSLEDL